MSKTERMDWETVSVTAIPPGIEIITNRMTTTSTRTTSFWGNRLSVGRPEPKADEYGICFE
jgi:hypothetical protein